MIGRPEALSGQTAIVTGGASGIGARTVEVLRALGAYVVALDKTFPVTESSDDMHCDLADVGEIRACVDRVHREAGRIDILVNCAGIVGPRTTVAEIEESAWDLVQTVNLKATVFMSQAVIPAMIGDGARGGRIVNISSAAAHRAAAHSVAYASSKAAIESVTRLLAGELAPFDVNVNAVAPGVTATAIFGDDSDEARTRRASGGATSNLFHRFAEPDDIAQVVAFLCLPESRHITGQVIHASAGSIV